MKNKAFTLIEIIVAVSIFSLFIGTATGIFISSINAQRKAIANQRLLDQTSYVMEYMSRALRMAQKNIDGSCNSGVVKLNYSKTSSKIMFENYNGDCQEFSRELDLTYGVYRLKEIKSGVSNYLTSENLNIVSFNIGPDNSWDQDDNEQPRVTIFLEIEDSKISESPPKVQIQTTISQRNLDVTK